MKIYQSWKRNKPDTQGYSITVTITYCSSRPEEIEELEKKMPEGMLVMNTDIELLKQQTKTKVVFGRTKEGEFVTECGNCGTHLDKAYSNCPKCNKELDWNSNQT